MKDLSLFGSTHACSLGLQTKITRFAIGQFVIVPPTALVVLHAHNHAGRNLGDSNVDGF